MTEQIEEILKSSGFDHHGWTTLDKPLSLTLYKSWISEGLHGDMEYLKAHIAAKEDFGRVLPRAHSAIVVTRSYEPHPRPARPLRLPVARYARGEDYHHWFREELAGAASQLKRIYPDDEFLCATDSMPVLERDLAYRAGLGWIGKNTMLLNEKRGSLFFIGEIITTLKLTATLEAAADRCGTCTRCIDACPTGAIVEARKLDARKCISYLTIEAKHPPQGELRDLNSHFYYGCDICQTVCPWNQKVHGEQLTSEPVASREETLTDLKFVLTTSGRRLSKHFEGTPLTRASTWHHKANAIVLAANLGFSELRNEIAAARDRYENLKDLGDWALAKLG